MIDPDTVVIFQRIKQHLENQIQPLIDEFNLSDLAVTVFQSLKPKTLTTKDQAPTRKQLVDSLVKGTYRFSTVSSSNRFRSDSSYSLSSLQVPQQNENSIPISGGSLQVSSTGSPRPSSPEPSYQRRGPLSPSYSMDTGYTGEFSNATTTDEMKTSTSVQNLLNVEIPDMSSWRVAVPFVEFTPTDRQTFSGSTQSIPVFTVSVRRVDFVVDDNDYDGDSLDSDEEERSYKSGGIFNSSLFSIISLFFSFSFVNFHRH